MSTKEDNLIKHIKEWAGVEVIPAYHDSYYYTAEEHMNCSKCKSDLKFKISGKLIQMHNIICPICSNEDKKVVLSINLS